jgi:hypothetical protein
VRRQGGVLCLCHRDYRSWRRSAARRSMNRYNQELSPGIFLELDDGQPTLSIFEPRANYRGRRGTGVGGMMSASIGEKPQAARRAQTTPSCRPLAG